MLRCRSSTSSFRLSFSFDNSLLGCSFHCFRLNEQSSLQVFAAPLRQHDKAVFTATELISLNVRTVGGTLSHGLPHSALSSVTSNTPFRSGIMRARLFVLGIYSANLDSGHPEFWFYEIANHPL